MSALHAAVLFASYLAFFGAVVSGVGFLFQEGRIKRKDPAVVRAGAVPLELLDRTNLWCVVAGFTLFSVGMVQGGLLARKEWGAFFTGGPKEWFSLVTWAAYGLVLWLRLTAGFRGRRVVFLSVMAFLLVVLTFHLISHGHRGTGP
ncbi:MAG: cytochrome c biogenesis protein CcsA [Candidatus Omnitrophica bacterium]|nr:cytochrome c biogenesis protein CcsA [Candidatus Omnitrophota bacterium]